MITILGGSGYVGRAYCRALARENEPVDVLKRTSLDYSQPGRLIHYLREQRPSFLINAAGYTGKPNVDACEDEKAECLFANAVLPGRIAEACAEAGVPWGHVSSGCIYSGRRSDGGPFTEVDPPNFSFRSPPCSFYSGTKALGEEMLDGFSNVYVWRLRIPFGNVDSPRNYLSKLMRYDRLLDAENSITDLDEFVSSTLATWRSGIPFGVYNVTNPGVVTTREVVRIIRDVLGLKKNFLFFDDEVEFMAKAARTPRSNCVLSSEKLRNAGIKLTEVHEAIERALRNWSVEG